MKKSIVYLVVLTSALIAFNAFAAWTIPGSQCKPVDPRNASYRYDLSDNSIENSTSVRSLESRGVMKVRCVSPVYSGYGSVLEMDFVVRNNSSGTFSCRGFTLDGNGKLVQQTAYVSGSSTYSWHPPPTLTAKQSRTYYSVGEPVTVVAECTIPDGYTSCNGGPDCSTSSPSKLINIRVY